MKPIYRPYAPRRGQFHGFGAAAAPGTPGGTVTAAGGNCTPGLVVDPTGQFCVGVPGGTVTTSGLTCTPGLVVDPTGAICVAVPGGTVSPSGIPCTPGFVVDPTGQFCAPGPSATVPAVGPLPVAPANPHATAVVIGAGVAAAAVLAFLFL